MFFIRTLDLFRILIKETEHQQFFHQEIAGYGPLHISDQGDRDLCTIDQISEEVYNLQSADEKRARKKFKTDKHTDVWTLRLVDRIGQVDRFGEKS